MAGVGDLGSGYVDPSNRTSKVLNAIVTDKNKGDVSVDDFLNLMVAQLQNQDFMNPVDDTQYVTQLAQFATMTQMTQMAELAQNTYVASLPGKNVTVARYTVSGDVEREIGKVQKISLVNNEYLVYVNDKSYSLDQIMEINDPTEATVNTTGKDVSATLNKDGAVTIKWPKATTDTVLAEQLEYAVFYSTDEKLNTVGEVENASVARGYVKNNTEDTISGLDLESGKTYYFNVIVRDPSGEKFVYNKVMVEA